MRKYQKFSKILTLSLFCLSQIPLNTNVLGESTVPENGAKGKLVVKKTDDQNKPLSKATFVLKPTAQPENKIKKETAEVTGEATFDNLTPGDYTLSEETAPEGYKKTNQTWQVKVENDGKTKISDNKSYPVETRKENLNSNYPKSELYPDTKGQTPEEKYNLLKINESKPSDSEEFKAVNPYSSDGTHTREIPEGTLSKRIYEVKDLDKNHYGIELTVGGKSEVKTVTNKEPLDVVFVLDNSNSMNNSSPNNMNHNRAKKAAEALKSVVNDVLRANSENKAALVTYGSDIFDGRTVNVVKGFKNVSDKYSIQTNNYSYKILTSNPKDITEKIPTDAPNPKEPKSVSERDLSRVGETFTMKAFKEADDILSKVKRKSRKIIIHITDGVPTRSYAINKFTRWKSFDTQYQDMKTKGYLDISDYLVTDNPYDIKGNGDSYFLYPANTFQTQGRTASDGKIVLDKLYYLDLNLYYPTPYIVKGEGPVREHGTPTQLYINSLKRKNYDIFNFGIDITSFEQSYNEEYELDQYGIPVLKNKQTFSLSEDEATSLMKSFSSKDEYYTPITTSSDTSNNEILSKIQQQFEKILTKENSIVNGTIEDPMGDKINLQLANGQTLQSSDYTLHGNDGSVMKDGIATGGPNNDGGILKNVNVEYINKKLYVRGLNLGEGQKVTLTYDVKLDDSFVSNKFYDTNGRTTLNPKSKEPDVLRDFPVPKIRDVRGYPVITIPNKKTPESHFPKGKLIITKKNTDNKVLGKAKFALYKGTVDKITESSAVYQEQTSNADGKLTFDNLEEGVYTLKETQAPLGYDKTLNTWTVTVYRSGYTIIHQNPYSGTAQHYQGKNVNDKVKNIQSELKTKSNSSSVFPNRGEGLSLQFNFSLDKGIRANDYFTVQLDDALTIKGIESEYEPINIVGKDGVIAVASYDPKQKQITYRFTDLVEGADNISAEVIQPIFIDPQKHLSNFSKEVTTTIANRSQSPKSITVKYESYGLYYMTHFEKRGDIEVATKLNALDLEQSTTELISYINLSNGTGQEATINLVGNKDVVWNSGASVIEIYKVVSTDANNQPQSFAVDFSNQTLYQKLALNKDYVLQFDPLGKATVKLNNVNGSNKYIVRAKTQVNLAQLPSLLTSLNVNFKGSIINGVYSLNPAVGNSSAVTDYRTAQIDIINRVEKKPIIPMTGGNGIVSFILIGVSMMSVAAGIYIWIRHKKGSDYQKKE